MFILAPYGMLPTAQSRHCHLNQRGCDSLQGSLRIEPIGILSSNERVERIITLS